MGVDMGRQVGRTLHKLTAKAVAAASRPGYYGDGGGLWLQVANGGTKSWVFRFARAGRAREMGLGPLHTLGLADARGRAQQCRQQLLDGLDPIEARRAQRLTAVADAARRITFAEAAERYVEAHRAGWRNRKHGDQWTNTLTTYAGPVFGALPVQAVDTALVLQTLEPIWASKTETAKRLRGRIELVLDWATARGYRQGDNPARWRGHLDKLLPAPSKVHKREHHAALPYARIGEFMAKLRAQEGTAARAVEFIILTAARTSEAFNATAGEIDLDAKVWTVPAARMKAGKAHRVPLSRQAVKLLQGLAVDEHGHLFPGAREGHPLSNMAGLKLLERMGLGDLTVHGFRSAFRDWAAEQTNYAREVAEAALAHAIGDKVEAAYRRGDLFAKRAALMQAWADYCDRAQQPGKVLTMKNRAGSATR
ncbi:MAG: integrase arm-type DNA-binding domain-containing protein [Rubrivivax sp.]|nr:integrase arm-type DNA-binding domain-containing protein [Rubrivivax sp.]